MADNDTQDRMKDEGRRGVLLALALGRRVQGEGCPSPEDIVAWHDQSLTGPAADTVQAHVARCEECYSLWTGLLSTDVPVAVVPAPLPWWRRLPGLRPAAPGQRRRPLAPVLAGALAAGIAVLAVVNVTQLGGPGLPPIPGYELEVQGRAVVRGAADPAPTGAITLEAGNRFSVVLRPETTLDEAVAARALILRDGQLQPLDAPPARLLDFGVVMFEGQVGEDVILPAGASTLVFVSGRAGALPAPSEMLARMGKQNRFREDDWIAWRIDVVVE